MSALSPDTVIHGKAYVFWVKETVGYTDPDTMYGVVIKGNSKFGHQDFSYVCQRLNKKVFFSKTIYDGPGDTTWKMCMDAMRVEKPPSGTPKLLTDRPYTFAEIATIAYEDKFFTDPDGPKHIAERTAPSSSAKLKNPGVIEPVIDPSKAASDELANSEVIVDKDKVEQELDEDLVNMEERALLAESRESALLQERGILERKLAEVTAKLESSLEHQKEFMIRSDTATMTMEAMNDDTADKVVKSLHPRISVLPSLNTNVGNVLAKVVEIGTAVKSIPVLLNKMEEVLGQVNGVGSLVDSARDSLSEGLSTIEDTMASYGMAEDEDKLDIPSSLRTLVKSARSNARADDVGGDGDGAVPVDDHEQRSSLCYYISHSMVATFTCKCGCGHEVQFEPTGPPIGPSYPPTRLGLGPAPGQTSQPGLLAPPVVTPTTPIKKQHAPGNAPTQPTTYIVPPGPQGYQFTAAPVVSSLGSAPQSSEFSTPGASNSATSEETEELPRKTRKEKRQARTNAYRQESAAKKLNLGQSGNQDAGAGGGRGGRANYGQPGRQDAGVSGVSESSTRGNLGQPGNQHVGVGGRGGRGRANFVSGFNFNGPWPRQMLSSSAAQRPPPPYYLPNRGNGILPNPVWLNQPDNYYPN